MKMERHGAYLINTDVEGFIKYKTLKNINEARENEMKDQREEVNSLRQELQELKELLKGLGKCQST